MMTDIIIAKLNELNYTYNYYGIRACDEVYAVGDPLPCSYDQYFQVPYDEQEQLDGTCCTGFGYLWFDGEQEDVALVEKALRINSEYHAKYRYLIAGNDADYGNDDGELIIKNAVVVAVLCGGDAN